MPTVNRQHSGPRNLRSVAALAGIALLLILAGGCAGFQDAYAVRESATPKPADVRRAAIERKLDEYSTLFPEIQFVHFEGGERWHGEMVSLMMGLGTDPEPLDFEHPPQLRKELMSVVLDRITRMLRHDIISATTFRRGRDSAIDRPNLCVITINADRLMTDDVETTRYMLDASSEVMDKIHPVRYLDHKEHLAFAIDHEVYHCLDSVYHGGAPMARDDLDSEYNLLGRESAADAFAMGMHVRAHGQITDYARNVMHIRALWLFSGNPNQGTFETLREILGMEPRTLTAMPVRDQVKLARRTSNETVGAYRDYIKRRVAAFKAAEILGLKPRLHDHAWRDIAKQPADTELVGLLANRYRYFYDQLFTDIEIPFEAPRLTESPGR